MLALQCIVHTELGHVLRLGVAHSQDHLFCQILAFRHVWFECKSKVSIRLMKMYNECGDATIALICHSAVLQFPA